MKFQQINIDQVHSFLQELDKKGTDLKLEVSKTLFEIGILKKFFGTAFDNCFYFAEI